MEFEELTCGICQQ